MQTCYLIRTHRDPAQIVRLVRTIRRGSPASRILVWHDASGCALDPAPFADLAGVEIHLDREPTRRGGFAMLSGYLRAAERLLAETELDWLVYLSGQDYPTRPLAASERFLAESGQDGFIRWWDVRSAASPWGRRRGVRRYYYRYYDPAPWTHPLLRGLRKANDLQTLVHLHLTYGVRLGVRARTPFGPGLACYGGLQWHSLSRPCVEHLVRFARERPRVLRHYERTIVPDESFLQTALVNGGRFRLVNDDLRFYDFAGSRDGHPRVLDLADLPRLTSGAWHFARKLDLGRDPELFDRLDEHVFA
ncbi:MAG TPA: beta-1,6-N-acetylglucosaminyltransferase [Thermoanaerobaculia bacterium]